MNDTKALERKQFEEVHCGNNLHLTRKNSTTGEYVLPSINDAWAGWQAAIESQAAELAALRQQGQEGMVLVPIEPTEEMCRSAHDDYMKNANGSTYKTQYKAMIAASQKENKNG